jgi:hypothetical protein
MGDEVTRLGDTRALKRAFLVLIVIAMLLVMVSVVICERVAPEMLHRGIGYGGHALVHHHGYDQETTSQRRDQTPRTCSVGKAGD